MKGMAKSWEHVLGIGGVALQYEQMIRTASAALFIIIAIMNILAECIRERGTS